MWLQRGDKLVALKKFGLANFSTATDAEIKAQAEFPVHGFFEKC